MRNGKRRVLRVVLCLALAATTTVVMGSAPAAAGPITPAFLPAIEQYAIIEDQTGCENSEKPGVQDLRDIINATYGYHWSTILRGCNDGGRSEHKEGRALDYGFDYTNVSNRASAQDLLNWLLATDQYGNTHAMARRMGIMYVIWNGQWWRSDSRVWKVYPQCTAAPNDPFTCHRNHVHFSFGWPGARRQTSWWNPSYQNPQFGASADLVNGNGLNSPDGRIDLIARWPDGSLYVYPNTGSGYGPKVLISGGWNVVTMITVANLAGDFRPDLIGRWSDGSLFVYPNSGLNGTQMFPTRQLIGSGWEVTTSLQALNLVGNDGLPDLVARWNDGNLYVYPNLGGAVFGAKQLLGGGWNFVTGLTLADVSGTTGSGAAPDGRPDIIGRWYDGSLYLYPNTGGTGLNTFGGSIYLGNGWQYVTALTSVGDDPAADLIGRWYDGTLYRYHHSGGSGTQMFPTRQPVGSGWDVVTYLT